MRKMERASVKPAMHTELRKTCQMKGLQFRSIAPKAPAVVSALAVLSCQTPSSVPDVTPTISPKSIVVPAQNYALMQVAGQEGTFSLVALPPSVSPSSPQPGIHKSPSFPRNLKLPIPRYQPTRGKGAPQKNSAGASPVQTVPSAVPAVHATAPRMRVPKLLESPAKVEPSEQVVLIESGASDISVATLLSDSAVLCSETRGEKVSVEDGGGRLACSPRETLISMASLAMRVQEEGSESASPPKPPSITVLSPAIFSKAVQIIPSPPKGKLPLLPCSKVRSTFSPPSKLAVASHERCFLPDSANLVSGPYEDLDELRQREVLLSGLSGPGFGALQKPAGKKRGRKRKTLEDILAFEARKKRSLSFFRRRAPEKTNPVAVEPQDRALDICKKYRSIRPKPVLVLETVPQRLGLSSLSSPEGLEKEVVMGLPSSMLDYRLPEPVAERLGGQRAPGGGGGYSCLSGRQPHRCPTCGRCFQFKHHLQSHMNSHTNNRPYACPTCRKAYAHSGSLSTHMKLHHCDGRPRKPLRCEFCEKAFGYVGVYFGHLRDVHKIILTVEPSISQHKDDISAEGLMPVISSDGQDQAEEGIVELQIRCARCQATAPTFADMKLHLLCAHGEEAQARPRAGPGQRGERAEDELARRAARYWRQSSERCNPVKLKRHVYSHHQGEPEVTECTETPRPGPSRRGVATKTGHAYRCVLCTACLDSREKLLEHWGGRHNCEDPPALWAILGSLAKRDNVDLSCPSPQRLVAV